VNPLGRTPVLELADGSAIAEPGASLLSSRVAAGDVVPRGG
jgi:hypothetical protein